MAGSTAHWSGIIILLAALSGCIGPGDDAPGTAVHVLETETWDFDGSGMVQTGETTVGEVQRVEFVVLPGTTRLDVLSRVAFTNPTGTPFPTGIQGNATLTVGPQDGTARTSSTTEDATLSFTWDQPLPGTWHATMVFQGQGTATFSAQAIVVQAEE